MTTETRTLKNRRDAVADRDWISVTTTMRAQMSETLIVDYGELGVLVCRREKEPDADKKRLRFYWCDQLYTPTTLRSGTTTST